MGGNFLVYGGSFFGLWWVKFSGLWLQVAWQWRYASSDYGNTGMGMRTDQGGKLCRQPLTEDLQPTLTSASAKLHSSSTCSTNCSCILVPVQDQFGLRHKHLLVHLHPSRLISTSAHALLATLLIVLVSPGESQFCLFFSGASAVSWNIYLQI